MLYRLMMVLLLGLVVINQAEPHSAAHTAGPAVIFTILGIFGVVVDAIVQGH